VTARQGPTLSEQAPKLLLAAGLQVEASAFKRVKESLARRYRNANMRPEQVGRKGYNTRVTFIMNLCPEIYKPQDSVYDALPWLLYPSDLEAWLSP
jgi:hypothetical protein